MVELGCFYKYLPFRLKLKGSVKSTRQTDLPPNQLGHGIRQTCLSQVLIWT